MILHSYCISHSCMFTFFINFRSNTACCAGVFNVLNTKNKQRVTLYAKYVNPEARPNQRWTVGSYSGSPSIVARNCTLNGLIYGYGKAGGKVCENCNELRSARGSSNPGTTLKNWEGETDDGRRNCSLSSKWKVWYHTKLAKLKANHFILYSCCGKYYYQS